MATLPSTETPYTQFFDLDGSPLDEGYIYIGSVDQNPETAPIQVFWDQAGTQPIAQPIRTLNGYPVRAGTPAIIFVNSSYSVTVRNKRGQIVFYAPDSTEYSIKFFQLTAAGSVSRPLFDKISEWVSVKDFGAIGNGVADDTASIQAAINFAGPTGRLIFFPSGTYVYSGVTVSAGWSVHLFGENTSTTILALTSGTATGINCTTERPVIIENFTFAYNGAVVGTAGAFISVPGGATMNANSRFRNLQMTAPFVGLSLTGAYLWVMDAVFIGNHVSVGVIVGNTFVGDSGDSTIRDCLFSTVSTTATAVRHLSSGGLRIINNKNIGGFTFYQLNLAAGVNTSDLLVTGNSIEGTSSSGFLATRAAGTGTFTNVVITGNQFAGIQFPINFNDGTAGWFGNVSVTGNTIAVPTNGIGVNISAARCFSIGGNAFTAADATSKAINIAAAADSGNIGANEYAGFTTAYTNSSPTTSSVKKMLYGTANGIVCNVATGALFRGAQTVTFPVGFFSGVPNVQATVRTPSTDGISALAASATAASVSIQGITTVNGSSVAVDWVAMEDH